MVPIIWLTPLLLMFDVPNMDDIDWIPKSGENLMTQEINGGTFNIFQLDVKCIHALHASLWVAAARH